MHLLLVFLLLASPIAPQKKKKQNTARAQQEEVERYYKKWLEEDVKYIIAGEEKSVFANLTTDEERENFIEQFWIRRDTNPRTSANEYKIEHYRRIAFVNERFGSGKPGWMTDRGRIYIIHGEPTYIERHPSGGNYTRKGAEGSGQSYAYPFEVWNYRELDYNGFPLELEFVDPSFSGEYRLALLPEEKDMLLYVPGTAPTMQELQGPLDGQGTIGRKDRPYFNPRLNPVERSKYGYTYRDRPFQRYAAYAHAQKAPEIKFKDLRQFVETSVSYDNLPVDIRSDLIMLNDGQYLAPITMEVSNESLDFSLQANGKYRADIDIYGIVKTMVGKVVAEFEDVVVAEYPREHLDLGRQIRSVYQKMVVVDAGNRYRLDVVIRDHNSKRSTLVQSAIIAPKVKSEGLEASSLILSRFSEAAPEDAQEHSDRFILGDLKIIPNVTNEFRAQDPLKAYLQLYNVTLDQSTLLPSLEIRYTLRKKNEILAEFQDNTGFTIHYYSPQRLVLLREMRLDSLAPGTYDLDISVKDLITEGTVRSKGRFKVLEPIPVAQQTVSKR